MSSPTLCTPCDLFLPRGNSQIALQHTATVYPIAGYWSAVLHNQALTALAIPHFQNAKWQEYASLPLTSLANVHKSNVRSNPYSPCWIKQEFYSFMSTKWCSEPFNKLNNMAPFEFSHSPSSWGVADMLMLQRLLNFYPFRWVFLLLIWYKLFNLWPSYLWLTFHSPPSFYSTVWLLLPLAGLRRVWVEGHSGWHGEGAMGGYLFNNSKMLITVYSEELLY